MEKIIKVVDKKSGIVQVTTVDERWYAQSTQDPITQLPVYEYVPSVTWICDYYPKGIAFYKWLANKGWDEAQAIKESAGDRGSKVHQAIGDLLNGHPVEMTGKYENPSTGQVEPLTLEEYDCLLAFADWFRAVKPTPIKVEFTVWNHSENYAGTVDLLCLINGVHWLIDFKTGQSIWPSHELQVSAYKHALAELILDLKLAILQLGYRRNKMKYKFTEIEDQFPLFLATKQIWAKETAGQKPLQRDYPVYVLLGIKEPEKKVEDIGDQWAGHASTLKSPFVPTQRDVENADFLDQQEEGKK